MSPSSQRLLLKLKKDIKKSHKTLNELELQCTSEPRSLTSSLHRKALAIRAAAATVGIILLRDATQETSYGEQDEELLDARMEEEVEDDIFDVQMEQEEEYEEVEDNILDVQMQEEEEEDLEEVDEAMQSDEDELTCVTSTGDVTMSIEEEEGRQTAMKRKRENDGATVSHQ